MIEALRQKGRIRLVPREMVQDLPEGEARFIEDLVRQSDGMGVDELLGSKLNLVENGRVSSRLIHKLDYSNRWLRLQAAYFSGQFDPGIKVRGELGECLEYYGCRKRS